MRSLMEASRPPSRGATLLIRGEPGTGKTSLLEAALAFPGSRALASSTALVSLERLISGSTQVRASRRAATASAPLLLVVDDCEQLPERSWKQLLDLTRHLVNEQLALVLAWSELPWERAVQLHGAPVEELLVGGLTVPQAARLLGANGLHEPRADVLEAIVARTGGNPLAILDVCGALGEDELDGWHPLPTPLPIGDSLTGVFLRVLSSLPERTLRALTVVAAARHRVGDIEAALPSLGVELEDLEAAREAGVLILRRDRVELGHPLLGSAIFAMATPDLRFSAYDALAEGELGNRARGAAGMDGMGPAGPERDRALLRVKRSFANFRDEIAEEAALEELLGQEAGSLHDGCRHYLAAASSRLAQGMRTRASACLASAEELAASKTDRAAVARASARVRLAGDLGLGTTRVLYDALAADERLKPEVGSGLLLDAAECDVLAGRSHLAAITAAGVFAARSTQGWSKALADLSFAALTANGPGCTEPACPDRALATLGGCDEAFPGSPQLAAAIGLGFCLRGTANAGRYARWLSDRTERFRNRPLEAAALVVAAAVALRAGALEEARSLADRARLLADRCEQPVLQSVAIAQLAEVAASLGDRQACFASAESLMGLDPTAIPLASAAGCGAIADLMLGYGDAARAVTWIGAAQSPGGADGRLATHTGEADRQVSFLAPVAAEAYILSGRKSAAMALLSACEIGGEVTLFAGVGSYAGWRPRVLAMLAEGPEEATALFLEAKACAKDAPLALARSELRFGQLLVDFGRPAEAVEHLELARSAYVALGAMPWAALGERAAAAARQLLPPPTAPEGRSAEHPEVTNGHAAPSAVMDSEGDAEYVLTLLGGFAMHRSGALIECPQGRPAEVVKIVALRGQVLVEELAELLWPEAPFGTGTRRLRNVLWRVRSLCGDVVVRSGSMLRLAPGACVDVAAFRVLARRALGSDLPPAEASAIAREALELYRGVLLPEDSYADWAAGERESLSHLHESLLELLARDASSRGQYAEALVLIERLVAANSYEERHYLHAASVELASGRRRNAMSWIKRAESVMVDLGLPPSAELLAAKRAAEQAAIP